MGMEEGGLPGSRGERRRDTEERQRKSWGAGSKRGGGGD